jgi:hypothetical protein
MNLGALDDSYAQLEVYDLIEKFKIKRVVETGTYLGWSTRYFKNMNVYVDTIEINKNYLYKAKFNLLSSNNVKFHLGSSPVVLDKILKKNESNILFFLDAHWDNYWPLKDELNVIYKKGIKPVICIHDFFVPGGNKLRNGDNFILVDSGKGSKFGYDEYLGIPLDINYIKEEIEKIYNNKYEYHYTSKIDKVDSGIIYIYPKYD